MKTTKQLIDDANQAFRAFEDTVVSAEQAKVEMVAIEQRMADLCTCKVDGTLGEFQALFKRKEALRVDKGNAYNRNAKARNAAGVAYSAALVALAKDAGLHDKMEPSSHVRVQDRERQRRTEWIAEHTREGDAEVTG